MDDIKLYYFNARGRAEPIRMTLAAAGKTFKDIRFEEGQWATEKKSAPFGQAPYIAYGDKTYGESKAITAFVAKICGLAGKTELEVLRVEEVYCLMVSVSEQIVTMIFEKDAAAKEKLAKVLKEETIPRYLGYFEQMLKESGSGYFVASGMTVADLSIQNIAVTLLKEYPNILDGFPEIQKMKKNVEDNPKIKAYIASRPDTLV